MAKISPAITEIDIPGKAYLDQEGMMHQLEFEKHPDNPCNPPLDFIQKKKLFSFFRREKGSR